MDDHGWLGISPEVVCDILPISRFVNVVVRNQFESIEPGPPRGDEAQPRAGIPRREMIVRILLPYSGYGVSGILIRCRHSRAADTNTAEPHALLVLTCSLHLSNPFPLSLRGRRRPHLLESYCRCEVMKGIGKAFAR